MTCTKKQRLEYTEKAKKILRTLSLEEKIHLMSGKMTFEEVRGAIKKKLKVHYNQFPYPAGGNPEKKIPEMRFVDGPRGVVCGNKKSTCFPVSMLRGATFNKDLEERVGEVIGTETLAFGGNTFAGVCINLPYHPGWGRCQETYGEDSYHLGEMGSALTRGVQSKGVIACVKHFAFNQMENSRFTVDITADKRTEREVFLPHFKKCIDSGAAAIMSAYNKYKGVMCGHNEYLLNEVLKKDWDFDGFVMSDFVWGVKDTVEAANSGQDIEMPVTKYYGDLLVQAVKDGKVKESAIDDSALRIIRTLIAFEDCKEKVSPSESGTPEHIAVALECAREGITLMQNKDNLLPLKRESTKRIVVLGKLADSENTGDKGSSQVHPAYVVTPLAGIRKTHPDAEIIYYGGENTAHAKELASNADAVIVVAGYDFNDEGEYVAPSPDEVYTEACGGDRQKGLGLQQRDLNIINAVAPVNKNTIVALVGGSMIMVNDWKDKVSSILMTYYAGMEGGTALAEIIFGDVNPSGKLPFVVPEKETNLPSLDWNATDVHYDYYHGYAKLDKEGIKPQFPFGFGLSYTTFEISAAKAWSDGKKLYACVDVKNTGDMEGAQVLQMYIGTPKGKIERPEKALKGFEKVVLQMGEKRTVIVSCPLSELEWFNEDSNDFEMEHTEYCIYIGTSSAREDLLTASVNL